MAASSRKIIKILIFLAIIAAIAAFFLYRAFHVEPPSYMTVQPQVRDIVRQVYATGTVEGKTQVDVGAQASGQILKLYVQTGDEVKKGDPLCEIDPKTQENALKSAQSQLEITEANITAKKSEIKKLKAEADRQSRLIKNQATAQQDYESAVSALEVAQAELRSLNATLEQNKTSVDTARTNLGYTHITAPMDGTVYATVVDEGQTVNASQTTPTILRLADLSEVTVKTEISEADVVNVKSGQECTFTILGAPHRTFKGVLGRIAPAPSSYESSSSSTSSSSSSSSSSSTSAIYYNADINVKNPDGLLRIDMTADVTVNVASAKQVLAVPLTALRDDQGDKAEIYVLGEDGLVHSRSIGAGIRDDQYVQVLSGLDKNDRVVIGDDVSTAESAALKNDRRRRGPF
jgi:macrolide-specific efflux system membrane fusion protein